MPNYRRVGRGIQIFSFYARCAFISSICLYIYQQYIIGENKSDSFAGFFFPFPISYGLSIDRKEYWQKNEEIDNLKIFSFALRTNQNNDMHSPIHLVDEWQTYK